MGIRAWSRRRVEGLVDLSDELGMLGPTRMVRDRVAKVDIDRALAPDEMVKQEIRHHWVMFVWPTLLLALVLVLGVAVLANTSVDVLWIPGLVFLIGLGYATDRLLNVWRDRFVITDSRVVRISGVYSRTVAWMPLTRVLDITVLRPFWLRPFKCGHLVLENAAQEQGLRDVRFISHPNRHALLIHELRSKPSTPTPMPKRPVPNDSGHPPRPRDAVRPWRQPHR